MTGPPPGTGRRQIDEDELRRLWLSRMTDRQIAERMGFSTRSTMRRYAQVYLKLPGRHQLRAKVQKAGGRRPLTLEQKELADRRARAQRGLDV